MKIKLGIHLGFAINRYPEPSCWARLISEELGIKQVKFVSDLLQPNYPDELLEKEIENIKEACNRYDIGLNHTFTSPRWNFFGNPNEEMRRYWLWWFKKFALISKRLGAKSTGSLLGIYSVHDYENRGNSSSIKLGNSGAFVTVYYNNTTTIYSVPSGVGNLWRVFTFTVSGGQTLVNTMTNIGSFDLIY